MGKISREEELDRDFRFEHLIDQDNYTVGFHCHDHIEIYLSISGGKNFIINDRLYPIEPGDLFVNNALELHRTIPQENQRYERYILAFRPSMLLPYRTAETDLLHYSYRRSPDFSNKVNLTGKSLTAFLQLAHKYEMLSQEEYGNDVMRKLLFLEMLTLTAQVFKNPDTERSDSKNSYQANDMVSKLLEYISRNITEDLSLDLLAGELGISKYHLCKIFKEKTGTTINRYIVSLRIAESKNLLSQGMPVTEVCYQTGFNNLSHFIRTFHNMVGISPGKYLMEKQEDDYALYTGPESTLSRYTPAKESND